MVQDQRSESTVGDVMLPAERRASTIETPEIANEISLIDVLILLRRNVRVILLPAVTLGILCFLIAWILPKSYTATTSFLPPQQASSSSALLSQLGGLGSLAGLASGTSVKNPADLYVGLMKSERVENAMIARFHLLNKKKEPLLSVTRRQLEEVTKFDTTGKDGLIRVSVTDPKPERAAEIANGWLEEYQHLSASLAIGEASQRRLFLETQLLTVKNNLAASEEDLKRTEQTSGLIQLDSQARALIETVAQIRAQISAKEVQVQSMRTYSGAGNTDLIAAEQELSGLRAQLAKVGGPNAGMGSGASADLIVPQGKLPQIGLDYVRKQREVRYNETLFEILARQFEAAKLDEAREGAIIQVVDRAVPPDYKSAPKRLMFLIGGFAAGFTVSLAWVLWRGLIRYLRRSPMWAEKLDALGRAR